MQLTQVPMNELVARLPTGQYEAALVESVSAPTMFRPYEWWHSGGSLNFGRWGNPALDTALDKLRHISDDAGYKAAVQEVHVAAMSDPPAIFLAWGQRARAVSTRFVVPSGPGRDVLTTLRSWKPTGDGAVAARN
jgi:ABC-type transport system substrate-binding protein